MIENNEVTRVAAAPAAEALGHFEARLTFETDCWDVHSTRGLTDRGFELVDVRSPKAFARGHVPGAVNIPRAELRGERLAAYPADRLIVVYCAGPHCNGANKAAAQLARLGRPVKEMIGGIEGWRDEGFELAVAPETGRGTQVEGADEVGRRR